MEDIQVFNSKYQKISIDIAKRIISGEIKAGQKLSGRSVLSSHYNVSPETIRRSISLLHDMQVVDVYRGSGIIVNSVDKAILFVERFKNIEQTYTLRNDLLNLIEEKRSLDNKLESLLEQIIDNTDKFKNLSPYNPVEIRVSKISPLVGKSIGEIKFWQNTGGTIIAIIRDREVFVSTGPYLTIEAGDTIVAVGGNVAIEIMNSFINDTEDVFLEKLKARTPAE
jgi:K+/H+ antiporter YhaU regulatory subunit KhtT